MNDMIMTFFEVSIHLLHALGRVSSPVKEDGEMDDDRDSGATIVTGKALMGRSSGLGMK